MAHFSTPFIIVNLGCELLYVIDQRLKAQHIPVDRAVIVLTDITSILFNAQLLNDLFLPQPVPDHEVIKQLMQDISASSIMKLDEFSWDKLWDLMSGLFKWQMSVCMTDVFDITKCHLDGAYSLFDSTNNEIRDLCVATKKKFNALHSKITANDLVALTGVLKEWLNPYHCKISVLIRLGLQKPDGSFTEIGNVDKKFLQRVGANIYVFDDKKEKEITDVSIDSSEVSFFVKQFKQTLNKGGDNMITLRLPVHLESGHSRIKHFEIQSPTVCEAMKTLVKQKNEDLRFDQQEERTMQQQLLEMLENSED